MPIHHLKLVGKHDVAAGTIQFDFEKPAGFTFVPGQYGGFTLINPPETDAGGITRRFSLLSTPDDKHISIAMRIQQSAFKRVLKELPIGSNIKFAGPTGIFTLHNDLETPAVLIAGGIGITPFYSMIRHALIQQPQRKIILFYGNQSPQDAAFVAELQTLQQSHPNFMLVATMVNPTHQWQGETGYISYPLIKKYVPDLSAPIFYICGSAAMVNALHETLNELNISADKIKIRFSGILIMLRIHTTPDDHAQFIWANYLTPVDDIILRN